MERGSRIAGRYTLLAPLGAGRGGEVWAADDARTGGRVAIKLRHQPTSGLDVELAGLRALEHPHLVRILDAGIDAGVTWVASEIVPHGALDAVAKPLEPVTLEALAVQMLDALAYLHAHGILHADVKTENVLVASLDPPEFKLGDFGFAHRLAAGGGLRGSPAFLPPEVIRGEPADERSDLYALGVLLYEGAFGVLPFDDADVRRVLLRHLTETPARLADPGDVNPRLVALLRRLLPKEPAERPGDARAALAEWRGEESALPTWVPPRLGVLVGRDAEMEVLERALAGEAVAVAVDGPPGIGKTRLLREFALRAELGGARVEWWTPGLAGAAVEGSTVESSPTHTNVVLVVDDVDALSARARDMAAVRLREVLLGSESRRLICASGHGSAAVFLSDALAAGGLPDAIAIELTPWTTDEVRRASAALLGARTVQPDLARLVGAATGGIPAGVEAACRALVDERLLVLGTNDALTVPANVSSQDLARSIGHHLQHALDDLAGGELRLLRMLALLETPASLAELQVLHPTASTDLPALQRVGLATLGSITHTPQFAIAHATARDVALSALPPEARRQMHDELAEALARSGNTAAADLHRAQGSDLAAARAAVERTRSTPRVPYTPEVLTALYDSLLSLWPPDREPPARHRTQLELLDAIYRTGESARVVRAAESMLAATNDAAELQDFRNRIARVHVARGDGETALATLGEVPSGVDVETDLLRAGALARQRRYVESLEICARCAPLLHDQSPLRDELTELQANGLIALGRFAEAQVLLESAVRHGEVSGNPRPLALHLSLLGVALFYQGRAVDAEAPLRRAHTLYEQLGERMDQVRVLNSLAAVCGETGNLRDAGDILRIALDLSRRIGTSLTTYFIVSNLARSLGTLGHFTEALQHAATAIDLGVQRGIDQFVTPALISRAQILATIGAADLCQADVVRAHGQEIEPLYRAQIAMLVGEIALLRCDLTTADAELERAVAIIESIGARDELVQHGLLATRLSLARADLATARETAVVTGDKAKEMTLLAFAVEADVLLAAASLDLDPASAGSLARSALEVARSSGLRESVWRAQRVIALAADREGDLGACVAGFDACLDLLREQCSALPTDLADAYLDHPDRAQLLAELGAVRDRLAAT